MQRIKILFVITKLELGGAQKQLLNLISGFDKTKFELFLFTAKEGLLVPEAETLQGLRIKKSKYLKRALNPFNDIPAFFEIRSFIKSNRIDLVHTHSSKAGILGRWAAWSAGVKNIVHTVHGWSFNDCQPRLEKHLFIALERITARFTAKLIVVCQHDKVCGLKNRIANEAKYSFITYAIKHEDFCLDRKSAREKLGFSAQDSIVGMISCFKPQKSPQDFIRVASLARDTVPGIKFVLVGDGVLRMDIEKLIDKFNLKNQVILTGWRRDIPQLLSVFDVLVLTSLWEGVPIVLLEAMAASLAVVATNTGGVEEIIKDGETGFLVARRDIATISKKLELLLKDKTLKERMGGAARNFVASNFYFKDLILKHSVLYSSLITQETYYAN